MTMPNEFHRIGPVDGGGFYPEVSLGDKRWEEVTDALVRRGTKRASALALTIDQQVQESRHRHQQRLAEYSAREVRDA